MPMTEANFFPERAEALAHQGYEGAVMSIAKERRSMDPAIRRMNADYGQVDNQTGTGAVSDGLGTEYLDRNGRPLSGRVARIAVTSALAAQRQLDQLTSTPRVSDVMKFMQKGWDNAVERTEQYVEGFKAITRDDVIRSAVSEVELERLLATVSDRYPKRDIDAAANLMVGRMVEEDGYSYYVYLQAGDGIQHAFGKSNHHFKTFPQAFLYSLYQRMYPIDGSPSLSYAQVMAAEEALESIEGPEIDQTWIGPFGEQAVIVDADIDEQSKKGWISVGALRQVNQHNFNMVRHRRLPNARNSPRDPLIDFTEVPDLGAALLMTDGGHLSLATSTIKRVGHQMVTDPEAYPQTIVSALGLEAHTNAYKDHPHYQADPLYQENTIYRTGGPDDITIVGIRKRLRAW